MTKKLALVLTLFCGLVAGTIPAPAQTALTNLSQTYGNYTLYSSSTVAASSGQTVQLNNCYVTVGPIGGNRAFFPPATNVPLTINDGTNTEVVTPSAVQTPTAATEPAGPNPYNCSFTATFSYAHTFGPTTFISSGDGGRAEAANDNGNGYPLTQGVLPIPGTCTGTATSSATLGLYGAGGGLTTTCTSTTVLDGVAQFRAGVAKGLNCTAATGGFSSSSGVVTVLKNHQGTNSAQAVTCTFGTGTSCSDGTHTFAFVAGDILGIEFTTQATETLANVACTVNLF
jgi:hypothetical protein